MTMMNSNSQFLKIDKPNYVLTKPNLKIPFQTNGSAASVSDPSTWTDYETALQALTDHRDVFDSLGFVFSHDCGMVGIDLDHCIDSDGIMTDTARDLIDMCETYAELSTSGTGVHLFGTTTFQFNGNNRRGVEIYTNKRFFKLTGNQFGDISTVNPVDTGYLVDEYFKTVTTETLYNRCVEEDIITFPPINDDGTICVTPIFSDFEVGTRNDNIFRVLILYHNAGYPEEYLEQMVGDINDTLSEPLSDGELKNILKSVLKY